MWTAASASRSRRTPTVTRRPTPASCSRTSSSTSSPKDAAITLAFNALWKASDFGDGVYTFTAGAAAALTKRVQIKAELLDAYITRPPAAVLKNDVSLITSFAYKF